AIKHEGKQHTSLQEESFGSGLGTSYTLKASAIRWTSDWKAPLRPKPCIDGPQIATVVGPPGEEIYCDEWGRVKVQFPWDRSDKNNDHSSCWIRVTQGWAGATWGSMAIPRVGQELVISHLDGDPDQPIATGAAYRQTNLPPYELPKHKTRMTIKSRTHKGEGFNELRFEDELGQEEVFIHAQKDQNTVVKNNQSQSIGANRSSQVGQDETITVGRTRMRVVKANDTLKVGGSKNDHVAGEYYIGVGKQLRLECGKTVIELNENGDLNITCENFNITGMNAGKVNTLSGKLDLNMSGKASGTTANGVSGADIQSDVDGYFNHE
ncbi:MULTISPECIES: type VI secretion system tip protein TssI/VgrG, partial [Pseudomonas]